MRGERGVWYGGVVGWGSERGLEGEGDTWVLTVKYGDLKGGVGDFALRFFLSWGKR